MTFTVSEEARVRPARSLGGPHDHADPTRAAERRAAREPRTKMNETIDRNALKAAIAAHAERSRELKGRLRRPWTEPMGEVQRALVWCRRRTTELLILCAFLRGRFHLRRPLREGAFPGMKWDQERYHRTVAERVALDFQVAKGAA